MRCAAIIDGEPCNELESEPPHGKMSGHAFVPPASSAPAAGPQPNEFEYPTGNASIDAAYAAGRKAGEAAMRERCERIARERLEHWRQNYRDNVAAGAEFPQYNMGCRAEAAAIADAIAKETT